MNLKETILNVLMVLSLLLAIAFTLWYIFGDTPTIVQLILGVVVPFTIFTFGIYERLNNKIERNQRRIFQLRETFQKELGEVKTDLQKQIGDANLTVQKQLGEIQQSLGKIEGKFNKE